MSDNLPDVKADLNAAADFDGDLLCRAALQEIEELEAKLLARNGELKAKAQIIEELEAKLTTAVEALERIELSTDTRKQGAIAMTTLAELKGETS